MVEREQPWVDVSAGVRNKFQKKSTELVEGIKICACQCICYKNSAHSSAHEFSAARIPQFLFSAFLAFNRKT